MSAERAGVREVAPESCATVSDALAALDDGAVTSVALVDRALEAADRLDGRVGAFLHRREQAARLDAVRADEARARGEARGALHGIPLGIKDILVTADGPTTAQSLVLDPDWGSRHGEAVACRRLRDAGAIVVGKTTTMEFAIGLPDVSKPFPIPHNPWDLGCWPGGSSSGTAAGVAAGMFLAGLGTDSGGSVRLPAALCGITGLKPTYGRIPLTGCVPLGFSVDTIGPMAWTARDCALLLQVLAGHDPSDPRSVDEPVPDYLATLNGDLSGLRIGVDRFARIPGADKDPALPAVFDAALDALRECGATLVEIELPYYQELTACNYVIMMSEGLSYHLPDLQKRWTEYGAPTRFAFASAAEFSAADYIQAQRVRRVGQRAVARQFADLDLIATPTTSCGAPRYDENSLIPPLDIPSNFHTPYWNVLGLPTISVPMGLGTGGLPLGMQLTGQPFDETTVLRAGDAFQTHTAHHRTRPQLPGTV